MGCELPLAVLPLVEENAPTQALEVAERPGTDLWAEVEHRVQPRHLLRLKAQVRVDPAADMVGAGRFEPDDGAGSLAAHDANSVRHHALRRRRVARDPPRQPPAVRVGRWVQLAAGREPESWSGHWAALLAPS